MISPRAVSKTSGPAVLIGFGFSSSTGTAILIPVAVFYVIRQPTPAPPTVPTPDIELSGRVVDFEKATLVGGADVQLIVGSSSQSQKTNQDGSYYIKVVNTPGNTQATLNVTASGFEPSSEVSSLEKVADLPDIYLKALASPAATPPPSLPGGGHTGGTGKGATVGAKLLLTPEQLAKIKAVLPPPKKRADFVLFAPGK